MEFRRRCTGKVEGDLVIFLFPSQCGRYGSADHRFDYFVSVSDVFVTLVYVGHAAAVYICLLYTSLFGQTFKVLSQISSSEFDI